LLRDLGVPLNPSQLSQAIAQLDTSQTGRITFGEFLLWWKGWRMARRWRQAAVLQASTSEATLGVGRPGGSERYPALARVVQPAILVLSTGDTLAESPRMLTWPTFLAFVRVSGDA
ncbi:hypothetical protein VOLCADRAFT_88502, partial [Volvox carteri f. nagariensis]